MTPDETVTLYDPMRKSVMAITSAALKTLYPPDIERSARHLGLWKRNKLVVAEDNEGFEMVMDVALMEPNPLGVRPLARFLERHAASLTDDERALAERMKGAWFSLFRVTEPHPSGGVTLMDLMDKDRELWLMDHGLGQSAKPGMILATRIFDAGPFHMGFGLAAALDEFSAMILRSVAHSDWSRTFRIPMSAVLYGHQLGTGHAFENAVRKTAGRLQEVVRRSGRQNDGVA